ncbi:MAG TPA: NlpC/P60 family protein [Stellaceae bacterium]|nr:NlpC/P60 family protein [Stellaceae bacterium]
MTLDPRLNAIRDGLADIALQGKVVAPRYAEGRPARVAVGLAPVRHAPHRAAALDTCFHYGETLRVFDEAGGYAWCQSQRDSYVGYVDVSALAFGEPPAPTHCVAGPGAYRYADADLRSPTIDFLPRHSPVTVVEAGLECRGTAYVGIEGGGFLPAECLGTEPPRSPGLAAAAALYLGCPYLWAGRSFLGLDCSGLVQEAFRDLGIAVPRDTDMQRDAIGAAIDLADPTNLRRDDLIFLPGHVMICAGEGTVIHAYGGDMRVRQDKLTALTEGNGWDFAGFTVRRRA